MNKTITLLSLTSLFFVGCNAHAKDQGVVVGNPDSSNTLYVERAYQAVSYSPAQPVQPIAVQNLAAPNQNPPAPIPPSQPALNQPVIQPNTMPSPVNTTGVAIIESVSSTTSPGSATIQYDETIVQ